jgi:hypothetical protein
MAPHAAAALSPTPIVTSDACVRRHADGGEDDPENDGPSPVVVIPLHWDSESSTDIGDDGTATPSEDAADEGPKGRALLQSPWPLAALPATVTTGSVMAAAGGSSPVPLPTEPIGDHALSCAETLADAPPTRTGWCALL